MTEAEWLTCNAPEALLEFLRGKTTDRKLRLFSVACCLLNRDSFANGPFGQMIELAEEFADGRLDESRRAKAELLLLDHFEQELDDVEKEYISAPISDLLKLLSHSRYLRRDAIDCSRHLAHWALGGDIFTNYGPFEEELEAEHALFVHDIFGDPFRPVSADPSWLTSTVVALAEGIYQDRAFDRMPILADALQDAGCDNEDLLMHCRGEEAVGEQGAKTPPPPFAAAGWSICCLERSNAILGDPARQELHEAPRAEWYCRVSSANPTTSRDAIPVVSSGLILAPHTPQLLDSQRESSDRSP